MLITCTRELLNILKNGNHNYITSWCLLSFNNKKLMLLIGVESYFKVGGARFEVQIYVQSMGGGQKRVSASPLSREKGVVD